MTIEKLFVLPLLALVAVVIAACASGEAENAPTAPPAPDVTTAAVLIADLRQWADFTGRLEAVESVEIRARVGGYVEAVQFEEGGRVAQGDLLLQIDPRPFQAEVDAPHRRTQARRGEACACTVESRARRALARAERNVARGVRDLRSRSGRCRGEACGRPKRRSNAAELNLSFTRVTAPIAGRVSRAIVTAGNLVDSSTLLTTLVSDGEMYAYFDADEQTYLDARAPTRRAAMKPSCYVGLINEEGYPHAARLDFVDNQVDPTTARSARARCSTIRKGDSRQDCSRA